MQTLWTFEEFGSFLAGMVTSTIHTFCWVCVILREILVSVK